MSRGPFPRGRTSFPRLRARALASGRPPYDVAGVIAEPQTGGAAVPDPQEHAHAVARVHELQARGAVARDDQPRARLAGLAVDLQDGRARILGGAQARPDLTAAVAQQELLGLEGPEGSMRR